MTRMTYRMRELVWGIQSEIEVITTLCRRIDQHVQTLNDKRAEAAERLVRLDVLVAAAGDPGLETFLREQAQVPLPVVDEHFPERLYRG